VKTLEENPEEWSPDGKKLKLSRILAAEQLIAVPAKLE
jgi:hypothetical protein